MDWEVRDADASEEDKMGSVGLHTGQTLAPVKSKEDIGREPGD